MKNLFALAFLIFSLANYGQNTCIDQAIQYSPYCDSNAFVAESEEDLLDYESNFGDDGFGPKDLIVDGLFRSNSLTINSPCKVTLKKKLNLKLTNGLCLVGKSIEVEENLLLRGEEHTFVSTFENIAFAKKANIKSTTLKIQAAKNVSLGDNFFARSSLDFVTISNGHGAGAGISIGSKINLKANNILFKSNGFIDLDKNAFFRADNDLRLESLLESQSSLVLVKEKLNAKAKRIIFTSQNQILVEKKSFLRGDESISFDTKNGLANGNIIRVGENGNLKAPLITIESEAKATLDKKIFLRGDETFRMDASTCVIDPTVDFDAPVLEGRCVGPANPNERPVAVVGRDRELILGEPIRLDGSRSYDLDGDRLTYQWVISSSPQGSTPTLANPFSPFPIFTSDVAGTYEVSLIVVDGRTQSIADQMIISSVNTRPTLPTFENELVALNETKFLDARSTFDLESDDLTYEWTLVEKPANSNTSIVDATQELSQLFIDVPGNYTISVRAFDGSLFSKTATFSFNTDAIDPIAKINGLPIFAKNVPGSIDGINSIGSNLTYNWSLLYQAPAANITSTGLDTDTVTFSSDSSGEFVFQLIVLDGQKSSRPKTFTVEVKNKLPEIVFADISNIVQTGSQITLDASASFDPDNDPLSYSWEIISKPQNSTLELISNTLSAIPLTPDVSGEYLVELTLSDGESSVKEAIAFVANLAPIAQYSMSMTNIVGKSFNLDGKISSDPDGDSLDYFWEIISKPEGSTAVIAQPSLANQSILADLEGDYVVSLIVTDGFFESAAYTNTIQVFKPINSEPTFVPVGDQYIEVGKTLKLSLNAVDPEGEAIRYNLGNGQSLEKGMSFDASTGIFTWTPTLDQVGGYALSFQAYDGGNLIEQSFNVTVSGPLFPRNTSFSGKVLESNAMVDFGIERPIVGATVTVLNTEIITTTNEFGGFILENIPDLEEVVFKIDTSTATNIPEGSRWANFIEIIKPQVGVDNVVDRPFYLPLVNMDSITQVTAGQETVVYNPEINIEVRIPADSAVNADGTPYTGDFSVSLVPANLAPISLPPGLNLSQLITVQPSGIRFTKPASITYPNLDQLEPGEEIGIIQMNDRTGQFEVVAQGVVSDDGRLIRTVSGGLINTSWGGAPPRISPVDKDKNDDKNTKTPGCGNGNKKLCGSKINRVTGELIQDLVIDTHKSLGSQRSIGLYYSSHVATGHNVEDIIETQATIGSLVSVSYRPIINSIPLNEVTTYNRDTIDLDTTTGNYALNFTFNTSGMKTGFYDYDLERIGAFLNSTNTRLRSLDIGARGKMVFNAEESSVGRAWQISNLLRVYEKESGDVALVENGFEVSYFYLDSETNEYKTPFGSERTLVKENGLFLLNETNGTKILFDEIGRSLSITDRNNLQTVFGYNDSIDRLDFIQDPAGLRTTLLYGTNGLLESIKAPSGKEYNFIHDSKGNITEVIKPDNTKMMYRYLDNGLQIQKINENGGINTYEYGDDNEIVSFSRVGEVVNQIDTSFAVENDKTPRANSIIEKFYGKSLNLRVARIRDVQVKVCRTYTARSVKMKASSFVQESSDKFTITLPASADERGIRLLSDVHLRCRKETVNKLVNEDISPLGFSEIRSYDSNGRLAIAVDPTNRAERNFYDFKGNLVRTSDYLDLRADQTFKYDPVFSQLIEAKDYLGRITNFDLDDKGNINRVIDPLGQVTTLSYNTKGQVESIVDFKGQETRIRYDQKTGNITEVIDPLGNITKSQYDLDGNLSQVIDPKGQVTQFFYDGMNRVVKTIASDLTETDFTYDGRGNLLSVRDSRNGLTQFVYDEASRVTERVDPRGQKELFFYNEKGLLIGKTDRNNNDTFYEYDLDNRLINRLGEGGKNYSYEYDDAGRVLSINDGSNSIFYSYDEVGRVKTTRYSGENSPNMTLENEYDLNGNRVGLKTPEGDFSYSYDEVNRLTEVVNPSNLVFETVYDSIGRRAKLVLPNGIETNYNYDGSNRLKGLEHIKDATELIKFGYDYDKNGNITGVDTSRSSLPSLNNALFYTYDQINQLVSATNPIQGNSDETFSYDGLGNRVTRDGETFQAIYDESNRLIENESHSFTYDLEGNMTSRTEKSSGKITQYGWDSENQMISITERVATSLPATKIVNYVYDVLGRRIERSIDGVITRYVYDNEDILFELNGSNQVTKVFTHGAGIDEPLSIHDKITSKDYFYHADHLGSVVGLSDDTGSILQHYVYDSFGRARVFNNSGLEFTIRDAPINQPYGYTARELDSESGLYYYRARFYNPALGRFLTEDPIGLAGLDSNFYRYVKNNPLAFFDPDGQLTQNELTLLNSANKVKQRLRYLEKQLDLKNKPIENLSIIERCFLTNLSISAILDEIREKQAELNRLQDRINSELDKNDVLCPNDRDKDLINLGKFGIFSFGGTDCEKGRDFWDSPLN
ncbi:MAG: RHS repeat-associated core domain-containing protein [Bdellovibrionota bacterium]|nr:RHS repeat-associated core domain-containing protein [Bdellovibrionota bacterium]